MVYFQGREGSYCAPVEERTSDNGSEDSFGSWWLLVRSLLKTHGYYSTPSHPLHLMKASPRGTETKWSTNKEESKGRERKGKAKGVRRKEGLKEKGEIAEERGREQRREGE